AVTEKRPFETSVAVRQAPLMETESPIPSSEAVTGASAARRRPSRSWCVEAMRPRSRTIPVNIVDRLDQTPSASASRVSRAIISSSPRCPGAAFLRCSASSSTAASWPGASSLRSLSARPRSSSALPMCLASHREMIMTNRSPARCSGLMEIGGQQDIVADTSSGLMCEHGRRPREEAGPFARDRRRDEEHQLVDEVRLEECGSESRPAFQQERLHMLLGKAPELFLEPTGKEL